jgi:regulator of sigma E protease
VVALLAWSPDAVWSVAQKLWWFLIVLGVLIAFHEFGHFLAARLVGVKVLKFSLGFGPKLFGRHIGETEYLVSAVPLGGYVKLFGEDEADATSPEDQRRSFAHQPLSKKMVIVAAGPGFNFLLAYLVFVGWLATGAPLFVPTFHELTPDVEAIKAGSPAEKAGLQIGDRVIRVNDKDIVSKNELQDAVAKSAGRPLTLDIRRNGQVKTIVMTPEAVAGSGIGQEGPLYRLGIEETAPVITAVMSGSPAMAAGFRDGDRVVAIEGRPIATWTEMTGLVKDNPGKPLRFQVKREEHLLTLTVTPTAEKTVVDGKSVEAGKIGISGPGRSFIRSSNPIIALLHGAQATWGWTELTVVGIYKMVAGEISRKNIGGPLTIASMSGEAASQGLASVFFLIAILSINLGVLNLLPIPILDGGHLLFFSIEAIQRKPMGDRQREIAQQVGLLLLVGIMVFAFWNDIERLISH